MLNNNIIKSYYTCFTSATSQRMLDNGILLRKRLWQSDGHTTAYYADLSKCQSFGFKLYTIMYIMPDLHFRGSHHFTQCITHLPHLDRSNQQSNIKIVIIHFIPIIQITGKQVVYLRSR